MLGQEGEGDLSPWDSALLFPGELLLMGRRCCAGCGAEPRRHMWHWQDKMAVMVNRVKAQRISLHHALKGPG